MVSYVLEAARCEKSNIRVLSDDIDVLVLMVYWIFQKKLKCKVKHWEGPVLDINATCADLGAKYLQLLGMHALSSCAKTSYPYRKYVN